MNGATRRHARRAGPLIVRHEAWCGMAYGESRACVCNPTTEPVDADTLAATMARDFKNRAQRRAVARAARRAKR